MIHPKITLLILNWNGKKDTLACLASLQQLSYPHYEVIVVDNGSSDDSAEAIAQHYPQHTLLCTGENLGFAEGNNRGIRLALERGTDFVLLLNNDTIVAPTMLEAFMHTFSLYPQAGIVGATLLLFDQPELLDHLGGIWDQKRGQFTLVGLREKAALPRSSQELDYVCGAAFMVKKEVFTKIGLLDPRFFLIWEEADFCFRAKRSGFLSRTCPDAFVHHKVSASFVGGKPHSTYFWWRNRFLWIERNCSRITRLRFLCFLLLPELCNMLKIHSIKSVQLFISRHFGPKDSTEKKELFLLKNKAALRGILDYLFRNFGNGPSWIYKKTHSSPPP